MRVKELLDTYNDARNAHDYERLSELFDYPYCLFSNEDTIVHTHPDQFITRVRDTHFRLLSDGYSTIHQNSLTEREVAPDLILATTQLHHAGETKLSDVWTEFRLIRRTGGKLRIVAQFNVFGGRLSLAHLSEQEPVASSSPSVDAFINAYGNALMRTDLDHLSGMQEYPAIAFWSDRTEINSTRDEYLEMARRRDREIANRGIRLDGVEIARLHAVGATLVFVEVRLKMSSGTVGTLPDQYQILCLRLRDDGVRRVAAIHAYAPDFLSQFDLSKIRT